MNSLKNNLPIQQTDKDRQVAIGLEAQSHTDVTSYPYPGVIRPQVKPPDQAGKTSGKAQSKEQTENWEDEGGNVPEQGASEG